MTLKISKHQVKQSENILSARSFSQSAIPEEEEGEEICQTASSGEEEKYGTQASFGVYTLSFDSR